MASFLWKIRPDHRPGSGDALPDEIVQALDASADDLEIGRIVDLDDTLSEMEAELEAHRAQRKGLFR